MRSIECRHGFTHDIEKVKPNVPYHRAKKRPETGGKVTMAKLL